MTTTKQSKTNKFTLVLGASNKPQRYSHKAIKALREHDILTAGIGLRAGTVSDVEISTVMEEYRNVDTITVYLNAKNQEQYEEYILSLKPNRVIFNPGAENRPLAQTLEQHGIETLEACTLVLLRTGQY